MARWREETIGNARLICGDCLEILPTLGKVDAVVTDPPYSEKTHAGHDDGARGNRDGSARRLLGYSAWGVEECALFADVVVPQCVGWIVWLCDDVLAVLIRTLLECRGRYAFAPLPYVAPGSRVRLTGDGPSAWTIWIVVARTKEQIRWGTLPGAYIRSPGWDCHEKMGGKPIRLMEALISDYSKSNDLICDPCMGGGATGVAAVNLGRRFIGVEIDSGEFERACERIDQAQRQQRLFA